MYFAIAIDLIESIDYDVDGSVQNSEVRRRC